MRRMNVTLRLCLKSLISNVVRRFRSSWMGISATNVVEQMLCYVRSMGSLVAVYQQGRANLGGCLDAGYCALMG